MYCVGVTLCVAPTFLVRFRPAGRVPFCLPKKEPMAQATPSCPFGAIHLEMTWGPLPVSTLPAAVLTVIAPRPPVTGACPFGCFVIPGGLNFDHAPFYSRPTGAFFHQNLIIPLLTYTAWCLPTCWVRRWSPRTAAQLPRLYQSRRCPYNAGAFRFQTRKGPVPPRQEGSKVLCSEPPNARAHPPGGRPT